MNSTMMMTEAPPPPAMPSMLDLLSWANPVFRNYGIWTSVLVIKMAMMAFLTGYRRFRAKPEDLSTDPTDDKVELTRRAHLNDLENCVPFILVSFVYTMTAPKPIIAVNLFRVAGVFRIWHSIVYAVFPLPQPARSIGFIVPMLIMLYMAVMSLIFFIVLGFMMG